MERCRNFHGSCELLKQCNNAQGEFIEAHHVRNVGTKSLGVKVSDAFKAGRPKNPQVDVDDKTPKRLWRVSNLMDSLDGRTVAGERARSARPPLPDAG
jgi:hypothetical protein